MVDGADERLALALERSWHSLSVQRETVDAFRGRATSLLAAASVIVGIGAAVGGSAIEDGSEGWLRFSIAAFAISVATALFTVWPRTWNFSSDPTELNWFFEHSTVEQMRSTLFRDASKGYSENAKKLRRLGFAITVETAAVGATAIGALLASTWS